MSKRPTRPGLIASMQATKQTTGLLRLYDVEHIKNVFECILFLGSEAILAHCFQLFQILVFRVPSKWTFADLRKLLNITFADLLTFNSIMCSSQA